MGPPVTRTDNDETRSAYEGRHDLAAIVNSARISVNFTRAVTEPNSPDNLPMRNGDRVFVPKITHVVTVIGAVLQPHSFAAGPDNSVEYYIQRSGGYAQDAEKAHVVVVRSNGDALPMKMVKAVEPGDTIIVPTAGMVDATMKVEKIGATTKIISDVLSSVYVLTRF
jgi:protein involved in polysaccharide export with SLBB domain